MQRMGSDSPEVLVSRSDVFAVQEAGLSLLEAGREYAIYLPTQYITGTWFHEVTIVVSMLRSLKKEKEITNQLIAKPLCSHS